MYQMAEYRERAKVRKGIALSSVPDPVRTRQLPTFYSLAEEYGLPDDMHFATPANVDEQTIEQEFQSYVTAQPSPLGTNILKFWEVRNLHNIQYLIQTSGEQSNELTLPTFFDISLDYLPIQSSAVPSERVFSSSAETDTKKRNRINPILMEALQMLKFAAKKTRLDFTHGWITEDSLMQECEPDEVDLLAALFGAESEDVMDRIIQCFGDDEDDDDDDEDPATS
jgi:hypothetical protein